MKKIMLFSLFITLLFLTACSNRNNSVVNNVNPEVTFQPVSNSFQYDQLNTEERRVYEEVLAFCKNYKGGRIELEEPISSNSWFRILQTFNYDYEKRFWPLVMIYVINEDGTDSVELSDEKTISKIYVQLNDSTQNEVVKAFRLEYSEDGKILNEEAFVALLQDATLTEEYYVEKTKQIEAVQQEIIAGMPRDIGQKDAVIYFCNWLKDNMEYDFAMYNTYADVGTNGILIPNEYGDVSFRNCMLQETATCGGFATVLVDLCNQVGIPAYVVTGTLVIEGQATQHG